MCVRLHFGFVPYVVTYHNMYFAHMDTTPSDV